MVLHYLDTFIGIVVILLGISLLIMILTQLISALLNLRGADLKKGLQVLFEVIAPELDAKKTTDEVLTNPLISDSLSHREKKNKFTKYVFGRWQRASAIRQEELIEILKLLGKDSTILRNNIETWFDKTMDRVSERFSMHMRMWTVICSVVVAFGLNLNFLTLYNQISTDAELRTSLVASATTMEERAKEVLANNPNEASLVVVDSLSNRADRIITALENTKLDLIPDPYTFFLCNQPFWPNLMGLLIMSALLSLGAPFWFNALSKLTSLRSILANREGEEREERKKTGK